MNFRAIFFSIFFINCYLGILLANPNTQSVHRDDFKFTIRKIADNYLKTKNLDLYNLPTRIQSEYENSLIISENLLLESCWNQGILYAPYKQVEKTTQEEVDKFIRIARNVVLKSDIDKRINDFICDLIHKNGLTKDDVKKNSEQEYESRFQKVKTRLNKIMNDNNCSFVYTGEIDTAVIDEFTPLIQRIKVQNPKSSNSVTDTSWQSFWNWLFGKNSTTNTSTSSKSRSSKIIYSHKKYNDYDIIYSYEIEDTVLEICNQFLIDNKYEPENIPARVVSDYSDAIQKIISQTKNAMGYAYSIYAYQIKDIAKNELRKIIDKIKFKGESCRICLDDIKSNETLGFLSCGHFFHKNCIQKSLTYNYKCPLCGTYINKINHTETVPLN